MWNPYLGQTRSVQPLNSFSKYDTYAFGYNNKNGYHKILRFHGTKEGFLWLEIHDCNSNSWRVLDVTPGWDRMMTYQNRPVSKGKHLLSCSKEDNRYRKDRFLSYSSDPAVLSCVRDEQLASLFLRKDEVMEIWITTKIDSCSVSWSMFLKVETRPLPLFPAGDFFIDEAEKKVVVVARFEDSSTAYIIGEDGYFKSADMGETPIPHGEAWILYKSGYYYPFVFSSCVPSLVQLEEKERD
ncbi:unnamed protein product [Microthlaspi erraticum]|uniref:F-box associated beta-propeller type 1 domain-containing protein n=1 Tax=Microthlaspi erraticum TaxID=1685480 RepID=A0A6D2KG49_9BRAS|nr:unnamed protein product [Microthlaspi erraticum]